jgi:hypothetical protein
MADFAETDATVFSSAASSSSAFAAAAASDSESDDPLSVGIELLWQLIESLPSSQSMAKLMKAGQEPACTEGGLSVFSF